MLRHWRPRHLNETSCLQQMHSSGQPGSPRPSQPPGCLFDAERGKDALPSLLGGSWVVTNGVIIRVATLISHIGGPTTPLITTHEPPSMPSAQREAYNCSPSLICGIQVSTRKADASKATRWTCTCHAASAVLESQKAHATAAEGSATLNPKP